MLLYALVRVMPSIIQLTMAWAMGNLTWSCSFQEQQRVTVNENCVTLQMHRKNRSGLFCLSSSATELLIHQGKNPKFVYL